MQRRAIYTLSILNGEKEAANHQNPQTLNGRRKRKGCCNGRADIYRLVYRRSPEEKQSPAQINHRIQLPITSCFLLNLIVEIEIKAMAFRSVLAKLGVNCAQWGERRRLVAAFDTRTPLKYHNIWDDDEYQDRMQRRIRARRHRGQRFGPFPFQAGYPLRQPTDNPKIMAYARLAVEHFNKQKNSQLQFVRAVKASCQESYNWGHFYYLTLEAVDAEVVKMYQAIVNDDLDDPKLCLFGLVADNGNGSLLKLFHNDHDRYCFWALDTRNHLPTEIEYSLKEQIKAPMQTKIFSQG